MVSTKMTSSSRLSASIVLPASVTTCLSLQTAYELWRGESDPAHHLDLCFHGITHPPPPRPQSFPWKGRRPKLFVLLLEKSRVGPSWILRCTTCCGFARGEHLK